MSGQIELSATVFCERVDEAPTTADLTLADDNLRLESEAGSLTAAQSDVFDVSVGSSPRAATDFFTGSVLTVGFDTDDGREVLFVDGSRGSLEAYAGLLYRWLLDGREVGIRHPAEVGGRVTGQPFDIGTLRVTPGKFGCTGINYSFGIDLDRIVHLSRFEGKLLGDRRTMIELQYVRDGRAVSLDLSVDPSRIQHLLGRHLRQEYDESRRAVRGLDIPKVAVRTLYKLYSLRGAATPATLFDGPSDASAAILRGLMKAGLVRFADDEVELTSRGWILVTEHVDASADGTTADGVGD